MHMQTPERFLFHLYLTTNPVDVNCLRHESTQSGYLIHSFHHSYITHAKAVFSYSSILKYLYTVGLDSLHTLANSLRFIWPETYAG